MTEATWASDQQSVLDWLAPPDATTLETSAAPRSRYSEDTETITTSTLFGCASWLTEAMQVLSRLKAVPDDWHSSGAEPPNQVAISSAENVLHVLARMDLRPNRIAPSSDEGVCVSFRVDDKYADIECFNSGEIFAMTSERGRPPVIWECQADDVQEAAKRISRFISG